MMRAALLCASFLAAQSHGVDPDSMGGGRDALPLESLETGTCLAEGECTGQHLHLLQRKKDLRVDSSNDPYWQNKEDYEDCEGVTWQKIQGHAIRGHNMAGFTKETGEADCKKQCCQLKDCKSFDLNKNTQECYFSTKNRYMIENVAPSKWIESNKYDYYEVTQRVFDQGTCYMTSQQNTGFVSGNLQSSQAQLYKNDAFRQDWQCLQICCEIPWCQSFNYETTTGYCRFVARTMASIGSLGQGPSLHMTYFEKKEPVGCDTSASQWCR